MITNNFKEGTLGNAACNMLNVITVDEKTKEKAIVIAKTDSVKELIAAQSARGANLKIGLAEDNAVMRSIGIEAAISAYMSNSTTNLQNPLAGQPIIDKVCVMFSNGSIVEIPTAICKAISANTALVQQGTLASMRIISQSANNQTNNKAGIKDNLVRENLPSFQRKITSTNEELIVKNKDAGDVMVGCHLDPGDLLDYETLNILISYARYVSEGYTIDAYLNYGKEHPNDENAYLMALRLQNRKLEDSIFDEVWSTHYDEPNVADSESFQNYINLRKRFHANLSVIGRGSNIAPYTHKFGIERVDVVTSVTQNVSSAKRISRTKKNKVNSYVTIKPQDTGLCTAVLKDEKTREELISVRVEPWLRLASIWLDNEARHMLGIETKPISDEFKAPLIIPKRDPVKASDALGISGDIDGLQDSFITQCYTLSEKVITEERLQMDRKFMESFDAIFK